jgi:chemotaxis protein MotB
MKFWNARWWCSGPGVVLALFAGVLPGCVSRDTYDRVVMEREELVERVRVLETSTESLDRERAKVEDQLEDLRIERADLEQKVRELQGDRDTLAQDLLAREKELDARAVELQRTSETYSGLVADLQAELAAGRIQVEQLEEGLRLAVSDEILFPSGSADLSAEGQKLLRTVAERLKMLPHDVEVQGHTDDRPLGRGSRFQNNWDLAGARATRVVILLQDAGVPASRLRGVSYGAERPIADNATDAGRARNRRIEIRLIPVAPEPAPAAGKTPAAARGGGAAAE